MFSKAALFGKHNNVGDTPITCDSEGHLITTNTGNGTKVFSTKAPTSSSAILLLATNVDRKVAYIENVGNVDVYLGGANTVTTSNGFLLQRGGEVFKDTFSGDAWYGIAVSGTADLRIIEVS
jgi:hypothetical protein